MTALVVVAVMAVHTLARDHLWRYEWLWATYQYHFGVLLIGPVLAGVAAWTGRDAGRARWLILPSGAASDGLRPLTWTLGAASAAYVACWAVPAAIVTASGTADRPGMTVALTFLPALAALAAYTAVGFAVGVAVPRVATAPVVAVATFGLTLLGWIAGFERLVRLGGAGTSMATLRPDSLVQAGQVAWYLAVGVLALVWAHGRLGRPTPRRVWAGRGLGVLAVAVAAGLLVVDRPVLDQVGVERTVCVVSSGVDVCAPAAYDRPLHDLAPQARAAARHIAARRGADRGAGAHRGDGRHLRAGTVGGAARRRAVLGARRGIVRVERRRHAPGVARRLGLTSRGRPVPRPRVAGGRRSVGCHRGGHRRPGGVGPSAVAPTAGRVPPVIPTPLRPPSPGVAASLLVVTAAAVVAASPVTIPLTDGAERLWPLASLAVVPAAIELDRVGTRWLEVSAGSIRVRRCVGVGRVLAVLALGWCLGAVVARWLGGSAGVSPAGGHGGPMIRNALAVLGATLGLRATRWADVAWVPITLAVLSSWLLGSGRVPDHPAAWALPLQPWSSAGATASLIAGGLVGIGVFVFRPGVR